MRIMCLHHRLAVCAMIVVVGAGCEGTGKPAVMSPSLPEVVAKSDHKPSEESPPKRKLLVGSSSPVIKPRQSLDEMFLFQPVKMDPQQAQTAPLPFEEVDFKAEDGTRLRGWWAAHPQPRATVLYLHGNGGNLWYLTGILRWLNETADCAVFAVDYRGYGQSEGTPTVAGVLWMSARPGRRRLSSWGSPAPMSC